MNDSLEKINSQIQHSISFVLRDLFPDVICAVTMVSANPDLDRAKVFISTTDDSLPFIAMLNKKAKSIRYKLAQKCKLRKTPELYFILDKSASNFEHICKILP